MSRTFKIILILSILLNLIFIVSKLVRATRFEKALFPVIKTVDIQSTRLKFLENVEAKFPQLKNKKFLFINVWSTGSWASMHQMPILDSLVSPLREDVGYLFVSEDKQDYAKRSIKAHTQAAKNFNYIHEQENFLTSIYQEKGLNLRNRIAPMNIIMDNQGRIRYFDTLKEMVTVMLDTDGINPKMTDRLNNEQYQTQARVLDSVLREIK